MDGGDECFLADFSPGGNLPGAVDDALAVEVEPVMQIHAGANMIRNDGEAVSYLWLIGTPQIQVSVLFRH